MTRKKTPQPAPEAVSGWVILHVGYGTNDKFKLIARNGSRVLHKDHLTPEAVQEFRADTHNRCENAWKQTMGR